MDMVRKFSVRSPDGSEGEHIQKKNVRTALVGVLTSCKDQIDQSFPKNLAHLKSLPQEQTIFHEFAPMNSVFQILSGVIKLSKTLSDGRQQIVGLRFPSNFVGSPFRAEAPYHAETVTPVHVCVYDRMKFERGLKDHRAFEHWLYQNTLEELDAAREWMLLLGRKYAAEKIASFLLMLSERMRFSNENDVPSDPLSFGLPLTRTEIADFLGLTIETVSRNFSDLKAKKIIDLRPNRIVKILDYDRLVALAEQELARKPVH